MHVRPISRRDAWAFIAEHHRHHKPPPGDLWRHSLVDGDGKIVGVAVVGRPVARALDDGETVEVTRLCTIPGEHGACSKLYGVTRRVAIEFGYHRGITYILESENGASVKAVGWHRL
jgi:tricorn protease-like protein